MTLPVFFALFHLGVSVACLGLLVVTILQDLKSSKPSATWGDVLGLAILSLTPFANIWALFVFSSIALEDFLKTPIKRRK